MDGERISQYGSLQPDTCKKVDSTERLKQVTKEKYRQLLKFQDLPDHLKSNEYILKHYRSELPFKQALGSLFSIHNETLNIWTHLVGFLIFVGLTVYTALQLPRVVDLSLFPSLEDIRLTVEKNITHLVAPFSSSTQSRISRWPFFVFLCGAMACLLFSSIYHLFNCHSKWCHSILHRLDHAGIAVLIAASFYPPVYYSFMCRPVLRNGYLFTITALGAMTILFSCLPMFRTPEFRPVRALLFFAMGVSGVIPGLHSLALNENDPAASSMLFYELAMGGLYGLGALLYAVRIPERCKPGFFDIVGHSHQIFHILVVAAAYMHYQAGLLFLEWRDAQGCQ